MIPRQTILMRFEKAVLQNKKGHWIWDGGYNTKGLPILQLEDSRGKTTISARRVAFELYRGEIPSNEIVVLDCKEEYCVNPAHLRISPRKGLPRKDLRERFEAKFQRGKPTECWIWLGAKVRGGYGQIGDTTKDRHVMAHRVAWELYKGAVPEKMCVFHKKECGNRACVNPAHLYVDTKNSWRKA